MSNPSEEPMARQPTQIDIMCQRIQAEAHSKPPTLTFTPLPIDDANYLKLLKSIFEYFD